MSPSPIMKYTFSPQLHHNTENSNYVPNAEISEFVTESNQFRIASMANNRNIANRDITEHGKPIEKKKISVTSLNFNSIKN